MYRRLLFIVLLFITGFPIISEAQESKNDLNFDLSEPMILSGDIRYGISPHPNELQLVEELLIKDYVLIYEEELNKYDFYYEESDSLVDVIVTSPDSYPRAVINIGFWGVTPKKQNSDFLFKSTFFEENPSIVSFLFELVNSGFIDVPYSKLKDIKLVIVRFKTKGEQTNDPLLYSSMRNRIKLQSRYLYVLWDTSVKPNLPNILKNAEKRSYPMEKSVFLSFFEKNPLDFSLDIENVQQINAEEYAHINLIGDFPDSLDINYDIVNLVTGKKEVNKSTIASNGIKVSEELKLPLLDLGYNEYVKVTINKPKNYNITLPGELKETNWRKRSYEFPIRNAGNFDLQLSKIPNFYFYYLDVSSLKNRRTVITEIYNQIKQSTEDGDNFFLFVSNGKSPLTASDKEGYYNILSRAGSMMADPPEPKWDVDWMLNNIDWMNILEINKEITIHYYLPVNTYKLYREVLISDLLSSIENRRWNVFITTDGKAKEMGKSSNTYQYKVFSQK